MVTSQVEPSLLALRTVACITAFNEELNIAPIICRLREIGCDVIVVDDGSTDRTFQIAREAGAKVFRHSINLGQGYALLTCFKAALACDYEVIIEMDADGQHQADEIFDFLDALSDSDSDIIVGSRILGSDYDGAPFFRRTFLPHFTGLINLLTGYTMTDAMCGFRAFRASSLGSIAPVLDSILEPQYIAAEMFIRFSRAGMKVTEVPINLRQRRSGKSTKGLIRYGVGVLRAILRALIDGRQKTGII